MREDGCMQHDESTRKTHLRRERYVQLNMHAVGCSLKYGARRCQARMLVATEPCTSVNRKSRPL